MLRTTRNQGLELAGVQVAADNENLVLERAIHGSMGTSACCQGDQLTADLHQDQWGLEADVLLGEDVVHCASLQVISPHLFPLTNQGYRRQKKKKKKPCPLTRVPVTSDSSILLPP